MDFFKKIGSPKYIVAPMVDQSDLPYRLLTRRYGAQLVYTQMFNSNMFVSSEEYRQDNFRTCEYDRPLIVQFAGHEPEIMLKAAQQVEDLCDAVDINLGCPQGIAKRGRYGAFLMEELDLLHEIVSTMVKGLKVPVTCKTRIYKDFDRSIKLCECLINAGASMLVIHGRTREEKGHCVGPADWEMLRRIKHHFGSRVPIIANGGISCVEDIHKCMEYTKVDGVMTSEAILENPALFTDSIDPRSLERKTQIDLALEYLDLCKQYPVYHIKSIRSHMMKFLYRYHCKDDDIRDAIIHAESEDEFIAICERLRGIVGDNVDRYSETWYTRYRTSDPDLRERLQLDQRSVNIARPKEGFLGSDSTSWNCDGNDDYDVFGALGMFQ